MTNNKRWLYLGVGTMMLIFCGLIYGWSLFRTPLSEIYRDWSLSQLSLTFTISMIFLCLGGFAAGKLASKIPPQVIIMISACLLLMGFFGVSRMNPQNSSQSLTMLYLCYGLLGSTGVGLSYNGVISTINKWFPDKQATASGIMMMGFGLGAVILGSIADRLIAAKGIFNTFFILGILIFVVLTAGSFFIKEPKTLADETESEILEGKTPGEMLRSRSFWIFMVYCVIANAAGLMVVNSAAPIALSFGAPAIVGMVVSVCNGGGRVLIGAIFDRFGRKRTMLFNICVLCAAGTVLLMGAKTASIALIIAGLLLTGISYGGTPTISSAFTNSQYGPKYFPVNFGIGNFSLIPAAIVGPMISSNLVERADGAYDTTFIAMVVCAVCALVLWVILNAVCQNETRK